MLDLKLWSPRISPARERLFLIYDVMRRTKRRGLNDVIGFKKKRPRRRLLGFDDLESPLLKGSYSAR